MQILFVKVLQIKCRVCNVMLWTGLDPFVKKNHALPDTHMTFTGFVFSDMSGQDFLVVSHCNSFFHFQDGLRQFRDIRQTDYFDTQCKLIRSQPVYNIE